MTDDENDIGGEYPSREDVHGYIRFFLDRIIPPVALIAFGAILFLIVKLTNVR